MEKIIFEIGIPRARGVANHNALYSHFAFAVVGVAPLAFAAGVAAFGASVAGAAVARAAGGVAFGAV